MPREKANYRDMLLFLKEDGFPLLMDKGYVCKKLGISRPTLDKKIKDGLIKTDEGKITIGSLARYLCD